MRLHLRRVAMNLFIVASGVSSVANAALIDRGNGMIYDTDRNITWLADANVNGKMSWNNANTWAANLSFSDGVSVYDNWRLPTTLQPDASCGSQGGGISYGYYCTSSEMGHLFYSELGGTAGYSILTSSNSNLAKFTNFQADGYWSATEYAPVTGTAWNFFFNQGYQGATGKTNGLYALAVSPGDVVVVPPPVVVPLPAAAWLLGSGLLGLLGVARRRRG